MIPFKLTQQDEIIIQKLERSLFNYIRESHDRIIISKLDYTHILILYLLTKDEFVYLCEQIEYGYIGINKKGNTDISFYYLKKYLNNIRNNSYPNVSVI